jgi:hypothetical protein
VIGSFLDTAVAVVLLAARHDIRRSLGLIGADPRAWLVSAIDLHRLHSINLTVSVSTGKRPCLPAGCLNPRTKRPKWEWEAPRFEKVCIFVLPLSSQVVWKYPATCEIASKAQRCLLGTLSCSCREGCTRCPAGCFSTAGSGGKGAPVKLG